MKNCIFFSILFAGVFTAGCYPENCFPLLPSGPPPAEPNCQPGDADDYVRRLDAPTEVGLGEIHVVEQERVLLVGSNRLVWQNMRTGAVEGEIASRVAAKAFSYPTNLYAHGELRLSASTGSLAAINVRTGALAWERDLGPCTLDGRVGGIGNRFFANGKVMDEDGNNYDVLYGGDLLSGQMPLDIVLTPAYSREWHHWAGYGRIRNFEGFTGPDGKAYLFLVWYEPSSAMDVRYVAGLYDLTSGAWVYERMPLPEAGGSATMNGMVLLPDGTARLLYHGKILVWNLATGTVLQSVELGAHANDLWSDGAITLVHTSENELLAYNESDWTERYRLQHIHGTLTLSFEHNRLYAGHWDRVEAYELQTGQELPIIRQPCDDGVKAPFRGPVAIWSAATGVHVAAQTNNDAIFVYER